MSGPELLRMLCYVIGVPTATYIAITLHRAGARVWAIVFYAQAALWIWYMTEITMIGMEIDTRSLRIIGTPMILIIATAMLIIARDLRRRRLPPAISSYSQEPTKNEDAGAGLTPAKPLP